MFLFAFVLLYYSFIINKIIRTNRILMLAFNEYFEGHLKKKNSYCIILYVRSRCWWVHITSNKLVLLLPSLLLHISVERLSGKMASGMIMKFCKGFPPNGNNSTYWQLLSLAVYLQRPYKVYLQRPYKYIYRDYIK